MQILQVRQKDKKGWVYFWGDLAILLKLGGGNSKIFGIFTPNPLSACLFGTHTIHVWYI